MWRDTPKKCAERCCELAGKIAAPKSAETLHGWPSICTWLTLNSGGELVSVCAQIVSQSSYLASFGRPDPLLDSQHVGTISHQVEQLHQSHEA